MRIKISDRTANEVLLHVHHHLLIVKRVVIVIVNIVDAIVFACVQITFANADMPGTRV